MKKTFQIVLLALIVIATSCKKDNLSKNNASNNPIIGQWAITSFVDNSVDKTSEFAGYTFIFDSKNNMKISGGMMMNMCNWTYTDSVYHFNMMGMHSNILNDLDDDWIMVNYSDTACTFIHNDPGHDRTFAMRRN